MQDTAIPKKDVRKDVWNKTKKKTKVRWLDDVSMEMNGETEQGILEAWRHIVEEAKAHPGL